MLTNSDYTQRYQPSPDGEFQSQHFGKHQSLSMEGYATTYWSELEEKFVTNFYSALSDEKRQDAGTTAANIRMILLDLFKRKDVGILDDGYTKAGPLPRINPIRRVTPSRITLAKLGRAIAASTWHQRARTRAHHMLWSAV